MTSAGRDELHGRLSVCPALLPLSALCGTSPGDGSNWRAALCSGSCVLMALSGSGVPSSHRGEAPCACVKDQAMRESF